MSDVGEWVPGILPAGFGMPNSNEDSTSDIRHPASDIQHPTSGIQQPN
jgi:hypothetical protein